MISEKIKAIRNLFDLSQKDFANKLNVSFRRIQDYEYGRTAPSFDVLQKIIQEFQIEPDYFFEINCRSLAGVHPKNIAGVLPESKKNIAGVHSSPQDLFPSQEKMSLNLSLPQDAFFIPKLNITASAGGGNNLEGLECYESGDLLAIDKAFFKTPPSKKIKAIKVDGYSMIPMLFPDSWVIFEETREFKGDGLYIINYQNQLMVKLLQLNPFDNVLKIISVNKDYESYSYKCEEGQELLFIQGKVLRSII